MTVGPLYDALGRRNIVGECLIEGDLPAAIRLMIAAEDGDTDTVGRIAVGTPFGDLLSGMIAMWHSDGVQRHGGQSAFVNKLRLTLGELGAGDAA